LISEFIVTTIGSLGLGKSFNNVVAGVLSPITAFSMPVG
jgi:hypothetical protein